MKKTFLLVAALCASMAANGYAQTNLAAGVTPEKTGIPAEDIQESLAGLTDGNINENVYLLAEKGNGSEDQQIQGFMLDLGQSHELGMVKIYWEGAAASDFTISVSDDKETWTTVVSETGLPLRQTDKLRLPEGTRGRYVKFEATRAVNYAWGVKMREFEVYKAEQPKLDRFETSKSVVKVGDTFTLTAYDQYGDVMTEGFELTSQYHNFERQADGSFLATAEGPIVINAAQNSVTLSVYIEIYEPKVTSVKASPAFVVAGRETEISVTCRDQQGEPVDGTTWTALQGTLNGNVLTADSEGRITIKASDGKSEATTYIYAIAGGAEEPQPGEGDLMLYNGEDGMPTLADKGWNERYDTCEEIDANGNRMLMVTNAGTFGLKKDGITDTGYQALYFDILPSVDVANAYVSYEGSGLPNLMFKLKGGEWNHVALDLSDATGFGGYIQIYLGKKDAAANPDILIDNIYLSKDEVKLVENVEVSAVADERGFLAVSGYAESDEAVNAAMTDGRATAYDLRGLQMKKGVTFNLQPKNPNAIILANGDIGNDQGLTKADFGTTRNVVVAMNGQWYIPTSQLRFLDGYPVYRGYFLSAKAVTDGYKYTRTLPSGQFTTVYLPTDGTLPDGCHAFELEEGDNANTISLRHTDELNAKTAYVVFNANERNVELTCENTESSDLDFRHANDDGSIINETSTVTGNVTANGNYGYFAPDGTQFTVSESTEAGGRTLRLVQMSDQATVLPFRVYFTLPEGINPASVKLSLPDVFTGISDMETDKNDSRADIYSIDGTLIKKNANPQSGLAKGIYIINGKKFVVK